MSGSGDPGYDGRVEWVRVGEQEIAMSMAIDAVSGANSVTSDCIQSRVLYARVVRVLYVEPQGTDPDVVRPSTGSNTVDRGKCGGRVVSVALTLLEATVNKRGLGS